MSGFDDLHKLERDLTDAPEGARDDIKKAVGISLLLGKRAWQAKARRRYLGGYAADISYETKNLAASIEGELGPTPGDQGSLAIVEDSRGGVRGTPQRNYLAAETAIEADLPGGIEKAIDQALRRRGL